MRYGPVALALLVWTVPARAQNADVRAARQAMTQLDYAGAIRRARAVLAGRVDRADRIAMDELLGFAYGALDSARQSVDAFRELIFLDPDREPDINAVSPRITALYASALGQVLVVRHVRLDSATFTAGTGSAELHFQVSRPARVVTRAIGPDADIKVDSALVSGSTVVFWRALSANGAPLPPGRYRLVITASEAGSEYAAQTGGDLSHGAVDTVDHLASLPGYDVLPEVVSAPRTFRPLGLAALFSGLATGASLALENTAVGGGERREVAAVSVVALGVGLVTSLSHADPRPVEANVRYNRLLRDQLSARNADIASRNEALRRQVRITVRPAPVNQ